MNKKRKKYKKTIKEEEPNTPAKQSIFLQTATTLL
jgi:hypothetical protein